jgi:pSer/pThr/pTyr-binding forkhead associated (FHA) protein
VNRLPSIGLKLAHIGGPLKGKTQEFFDVEISIGRHPSCEVRYSGEINVISRRHAKIVREGNRFKLIDLSSNGTYVNGERIKTTYLSNGDVLTFAKNGPQASFSTQSQDSDDTPSGGPSPPQKQPSASVDNRKKMTKKSL